MSLVIALVIGGSTVGRAGVNVYQFDVLQDSDGPSATALVDFPTADLAIGDIAEVWGGAVRGDGMGGQFVWQGSRWVSRGVADIEFAMSVSGEMATLTFVPPRAYEVQVSADAETWETAAPQLTTLNADSSISLQFPREDWKVYRMIVVDLPGVERVLLMGKEVVLGSELAGKELLVAAASVVVPGGVDLDGTRLAALSETVQVYAAPDVSGEIGANSSVQITNSGSGNRIDGDLNPVALGAVCGAVAYLNSSDWTPGLGSLEDRIQGLPFTSVATDSAYGPRLAGDGGAWVDTGSDYPLGEEWTIVFRLRLGAHPTGSYPLNRKGLLYHPPTADGVFLDGTSLSLQIGITPYDLAHGIADLTQLHEFHISKSGSTIELRVDGELASSVTTGAGSDNMTLREIGRYDGLTTWHQDWDYITVESGGSPIWDFQFEEGEGNTVSGAGVGATINSFSESVWQVVDTTGFDRLRIVAPPAPNGVSEVDLAGVFYDGEGAVEVFVPSLVNSASDTVYCSYDPDSGDYEILIIGSPHPTKAAALRKLVSVPAIPIFAFTGQSNAIHTRRDHPPYSTTLLEYPFGRANAGAESFVYHDTITDAILAPVPMGAAWDVARWLDLSPFRQNESARFAIVQTGLGGRAAREWNPSFFGSVRWSEFTDAVDSMIARLEEDNPGSGAMLHTVVINQGEREGATGISWWAISWTNFINQARARYGAQVQFYIQSLNTEGLMPQYLTQSDNWDNVREEQLSLAVDSGQPDALPGVFVFDANALGGAENTSVYVRDNDVHYSDAGIEALARGTFEQIREGIGF